MFSFVLVFFFLCADTTWWLSWDPYAPPFSPADEATTSKRQLDPLPSQLSRKTEQKKKKIHNAETHIRELQSSINMIKIFVLLTIMDITQSVDPRNNIFLELMNMSRNALFAGKNVCMPHAPSVGAGIPWVAHPISKCDPECCTRLMDPTENLNKIQQDILGLSAKLHQMTEDNSSWFGNLLGKPWLWIKEIAFLLLFLLLAYYLCIHSIKCFFQQMTPASHEEMTVPTRKDYYP